MRHKREGRRRPNLQQPTPKSDLFSYHSTRFPASDLGGGRRSSRTRSNPGLYRKIKNASGVILLLAILFYAMTLGSVPTIKILNQRSDVSLLRDPETYQKSAQDILRSSVLNQSKITVNTKGFESAMKEEFPELSQATLAMTLFGHKPTIQLVARTPALALASQQGVFVLDTSGMVTIRSSDVKGFDNLKLPLVIDESNLPVAIGKGILTDQEVTFIKLLIGQMNAAKIEVESTSLPPTVNELHLKPKGVPYYVKFDMQNDPKLSSGTFLAIKQKLEADKITPAEYIDIRLDERAYYK